MKEHPGVWFFHDTAEFVPTEVGGVPVTTIIDAPESWESRLSYAHFTRTGQAWVKSGFLSSRVVQYVTGGDVEVREVSPDFFVSKTETPADDPNSVVVPKDILAELQVFQRGSMEGVMLELGEGGQPCQKHVAVDVLVRAAEGSLDDQTTVAFEMAYMRLSNDARNKPENAAFAETLRLEQTIGYNWELRKGELIAQKGELVAIDDIAGRLAADFYANDKGGWLLKGPCAWVEGIYTAPDYEWATAEQLSRAFGGHAGADQEQEQAPEQPGTSVPDSAEQLPPTEPGVAPQEQQQFDLLSPAGVVEEVVPAPEVQIPPAVPESSFEIEAGAMVALDEENSLVEWQPPSNWATAEGLSVLPVIPDPTMERFVSLVQQELVPLGLTMRPTSSAVDGQYALAEGRVYITFDVTDSPAWAWVHDVTDQCPGLAEFSSVAHAAQAGVSKNVGIGFIGYFDLELENDQSLCLPSAFPYLKDSKGGMSDEDARRAVSSAAEKGGYAGEGDAFESQVQIYKDGVVLNVLQREMNVGMANWEPGPDERWPEHCLKVMGTFEARKAYSEALLAEQVKASGLADTRVIDAARVSAGASLIARPGARQDVPSNVRAVLDRIDHESLLEDQHLFVAVAGYGGRGGQYSGMYISHPVGAPTEEAVGGKTRWKPGAAGFGLDSWRTRVDVGAQYFERKLQRITMRATNMTPVADGPEALIDAAASGKTNVPTLYMLRLQSFSDKEDLDSHRGMGVGYMMNDGRFGVTPMFKSQVLTLKNDGAFEKLLGYYQNAPAFTQNTDKTAIESAFERMAELAKSGGLAADTSQYFDPNSRAYTMVAAMAQSMYNSDASNVAEQVKAIMADEDKAPAFYDWMKGAILEGVNPRLLDGNSDKWLGRVRDHYASENFMRRFSVQPGQDALALVITKAGSQYTGVNTSALQESVLENPRSVLIDKHRKTKTGMKAGRLTLVDFMHYTNPELAEGLNNGGLVDFLRSVNAAPELAFGKDAVAQKPEKQDGLEDIGVVAGLAIKDLFARSLDSKFAAFRAMTELQRDKVAKRQTFVAQPRMTEYRDAGAPAAFAAFMDRTWRDLPSKPESMTVGDIEAYGALMAPMGKAFEAMREMLPEAAEMARRVGEQVAGNPDMIAEQQRIGGSAEYTRNASEFFYLANEWLTVLEKHAAPAWQEISGQPHSGRGRPYHERMAGAEWRGASWGGGQRYNYMAGSAGYGPISAMRELAKGDEVGADGKTARRALAEAVALVYTPAATFKLGRETTSLVDVTWEHLIKERASAKTTKDEALVTNHVRVGEDYRKGKNVDGDDFIRTFGFSGVEYGNWVSRAERQEHLNLSFDSMLDLAKQLKVEPMALSLGGQLGLCIGSRGKGGANAPLAHFEPVNMAINLTRMKGDGSLAHEYFHAIANHYGRLETGRPTSDYSTLMGMGLSAAKTEPQLLDTAAMTSDRVNRDLQKSFYELMVAIMRQPGEGGSNADIRTFSDPSGMLVRAKEMDEGRSSPYWATSAEMFARGMESWLANEMKDQGLRNDYLVAHRKLGGGGVYPTGDEFDKIRPYAQKWASDLTTGMQAVQHKLFGNIEMPVLFTRNKVVMPLTVDELQPFVETEFNRIFGSRAPAVSIEQGMTTAGAYQQAEHLVRLAAGGADERVVYHEGWHAARAFMLDDAMGQKVDATFADGTVTAWVAEQMRQQGYTEEAVEDAQANALEAQAYAFELWATGRLDFEQLADVYQVAKDEIDTVTGLAGLLDAEQLEQVFDRVFSGRMAQELQAAQEQEQELAHEQQSTSRMATVTGMGLA